MKDPKISIRLLEEEIQKLKIKVIKEKTSIQKLLEDFIKQYLKK